jgi:DNA invertase Pin-like site-specific DNA recombinase
LAPLGITQKPYLGRCCVVWIHPYVERHVPVSATNLEFDPNALSPIPLSIASVRQLPHVFTHVMRSSIGGEVDGPQTDSTMLEDAVVAGVSPCGDHAVASMDEAHIRATTLPISGDGADLSGPRGDGATGHLKITPAHLERQAVIYVRQSSPKQVRQHQESQLNQRTLVERAQALGCHRERIQVFDADLGQSAAHAEGRDDFKALAAEVALGHVGIIFGWEVSRLTRNNADWYQLLDLAALFGTPIADVEGVYDPRLYNDRLWLGLKGTMSEAELHILHQRLNAGRLSMVRRGDYVQHLPTGLGRMADGQIVQDPDDQKRQTIELVFAKLEELGSCQKVLRGFKWHAIWLSRRQTSGFHKAELLWKKPSAAAIYEILGHPAYAGAFVYGRCPKDPTRQIPGRHATGVVRKPMAAWQCLKHDFYPGYIT